MNLFDYIDYKKYVQNRILALPKGGWGEMGRIARRLRVTSTLMSQIFKGEKHLTLEQAQELAEHFALLPIETDYFLTLVEYERAGTNRLRLSFKRRMEELRSRSENIASRLPEFKSLTESQKSIFYSAWYYSGVRLAASVDNLETIEKISNRLGLSREMTAQVVHFLLENGLCRQENGKIMIGPARTHIQSEDPIVSRHHMNWRLKAMDRFGKMNKDEMMFTAPMSLARKDIREVRKIIQNAIEKINKLVELSPSEELAVLNIDWVQF